MLPRFLATQYSLDKQFFLIPRFTLGLLGFYPETNRSTKAQIWSFLNFVIFGYGIYAELYYGIHYLTIDMHTAFDALCAVATSIMSFLKLFYIWWYREEFKCLIERIRKLTTQQDSSSKVKIKKTYFTLATRLNALILFFGFCCSTAYSLRPIVTAIILYLNGKEIIYETPFKMMLPESLLYMPVYPLTYILVAWHGYMTALALVGTAGFYLGFCMYFATLLKALQQDLLTTLVDIDDEQNLRFNTEENVCRALADIITRHNEISELTEKFSSTMVEITLTLFVTSSLIIAFSAVGILLLSGLSVLVYFAYTCAIFTEIFLYCLGGNTVMDSSIEMATKIYCTHWYTHSVRVQKMVLLFMVRSQRTIIIKVPFFVPSLPALTAIVRFTGSVIALAKSII